MKAKIYLFSVFMFIAFFFPGCSKDNVVNPPGQQEIIQYELSDSAKMPSKAGNLISTQIETDKITLTYSGQLPTFNVGSYIVDSISTGYLRKVQSVQNQGQTLIINTSEAKFQNAFKNAKIIKTVNVIPPDTFSLFNFRERKETEYEKTKDGKTYRYKVSMFNPEFVRNIQIKNTTYDFGWRIRDIEINIEYQNNTAFTLHLDTLLIGKNLKFNLEIEEEWFIPKRIKFVKLEDEGFDYKGINMNATISLPLGEEKITLLDIPVLAVIPVGPVVLTIGALIEVGVEESLVLDALSLTGHFNASTHSEWGGEWNNGNWTRIDNKSSNESAGIDGVGFLNNATLSATGFVEGSIDVSIYSLIGPQFFIKPGIEMNVSLPPLTCGADYKLEGGVKLSLNLFNLPLYEFSIPLDQRHIWDGCGSTSTNYIVPLSVGNYWQYRDTNYTNSQTGSSQLDINGTRTINYQGNNISVYDWQWQGASTKYYVNNNNTGCWLYGNSTSGVLSNAELLAKYPVNIGENWVSTFWAPGFTVNMNCTSTNDNFATPLGTYQCYVYHFRINSDRPTEPGATESRLIKPGNNTSNPFVLYDYYLYFKPNVGFIGYIAKQGSQVVLKKVMYTNHIN